VVIRLSIYHNQIIEEMMNPKREDIQVKFPYCIPADTDIKICTDIARLVAAI